MSVPFEDLVGGREGDADGLPRFCDGLSGVAVSAQKMSKGLNVCRDLRLPDCVDDDLFGWGAFSLALKIG